MLQLQKTEDGQQEYAEFGHLPRRRFSDFGMCLVTECGVGLLMIQLTKCYAIFVMQLMFARKFRMKLIESQESQNKFLQFLFTSASIHPMVCRFQAYISSTM